MNTLVKIGKSAVEPLISAIKSDNTRIRVYAIKALGNIGDTRAIEPLILALKEEIERSGRESAAKALGEMTRERRQWEKAPTLQYR